MCGGCWCPGAAFWPLTSGHWPGWLERWRRPCWRAPPQCACPWASPLRPGRPAWWVCTPPCSAGSRYTHLKHMHTQIRCLKLRSSLNTFSVWVVSVGIILIYATPLSAIDLSLSLPVSQQHTNLQGLVSLLLPDKSPETMIHCLNLKELILYTFCKQPFQTWSLSKRQDIRAWRGERRVWGWLPCRWGEERSKEPGRCEDKGYNEGRGGGCAVREHKDTKGWGDKRLLEPRVAGTSSQSIEPSERSLHGRGGGSIQVLYLRQSTYITLHNKYYRNTRLQIVFQWKYYLTVTYLLNL